MDSTHHPPQATGERIAVRDIAHWHELRRTRIGSSDQPALWGVSPYKTLFQLWHEKRGTLADEDLSDNARVVFGRHLEAGIAQAIAEVNGLTIRKADSYLVHPTVAGMGASLDYEILVDDDGRPSAAGTFWAPFEIKNVDFLVWRDQWLHDGDGHEPPEHIDIQVQHQISCAVAPFAYLGVLVGGNTPHLIRRDRHDGICAKIKARVTAFWQSIEVGAEPDPDYARDLSALQAIRTATDGSTVDMRGDRRLEALIADYAEAKAIEKDAALRAEICRAEALEIIGGAEKIILEGGSISAKLRPAAPERTVIYKAQPAKRDIRFFPKKAKPDAEADASAIAA